MNFFYITLPHSRMMDVHHARSISLLQLRIKNGKSWKSSWFCFQCFIFFYQLNNGLPFLHCSEFHPDASHNSPADAPSPPLADPMQAGILREASYSNEKIFLHYPEALMHLKPH